MSKRFLVASFVLLACSVSAQTVPLELSVNGGFETGDFTGWTLFPSSAGNIMIETPGSASTFAANIDNMVPASNSLMKNANLGVGTVMPGQTIMISFDARGATAVGGVVFAQFFSELSGGGTSQTEFLGGGPLALDANPSTWKSFNFTTTTGPNVSGGVTLQLEAVTGGAMGSMTTVSFDNISITIDVPATITYPGSGDDLELTTGVGGPADANDVEMAAGGDLLIVNLASPGTAFDLSPYLLWVQLVPTAGGVPNLGGLGLPDVYLDLSMPVFVIVDSSSASPTGSLLIGPGSGTDHFFVLPTLLDGLGQSLVFQGVVSSSAANNNIYAITNAHEVIVP